jgi:hypothetical protein
MSLRVIWQYMDRSVTNKILYELQNLWQYMDRSIYCHMSFGSYNVFLVTDRSIYCHMTLSAMIYLLYNLHAISTRKITLQNYISTFLLKCRTFLLITFFSVQSLISPNRFLGSQRVRIVHHYASIELYASGLMTSLFKSCFHNLCVCPSQLFNIMGLFYIHIVLIMDNIA